MNRLMKITGIVLLGIGVSSVCLAGGSAVGVPEIDPASGMNALALLTGALLVIRGRRR